MGTGLLSIGVTGIRAAQSSLLTTEHNIVNAHTPGYTRQSAVQATNISINTGAGAIGQGVHVTTVKRLYDGFLEKQVNSAQTQVSFLQAQFSQLSQIDLMLADPQAGLSPALQDAVCTFDCVIDQVSDVGTHSVLFCRVLAIGDIKPTRNLLYHERQYKVCPAAQQSATP